MRIEGKFVVTWRRRGAFYFGFSREQIKNQPYKRHLAPDPGGRRPSGRGKWGPRKVARPCGERRMHCSGEGCPKQSIGSARLKRRLRPTSVGSLGRSPKPFLHPFVGTKGCPRRVGVQTMISKRLSPPEVIANYHLNIPPQVVRPAPVFTSAASRTRPPAARPAPG